MTPAFPSPRAAWISVAVLFVYSVFAMVDRQIMTMLVDPIRRDLGISDVDIPFGAVFRTAVNGHILKASLTNWSRMWGYIACSSVSRVIHLFELLKTGPRAAGFAVLTLITSLTH